MQRAPRIEALLLGNEIENLLGGMQPPAIGESLKPLVGDRELLANQCLRFRNNKPYLVSFEEIF
jgi:hypothetical protein